MFRRCVMLLAVPLALLLLVGCAKATQPGGTRQKVLDQSALEDRVGTVLHDHYKLEYQSLSCPDDQPVRVGRSFDCSVEVGGNPQEVTVTVTNADGQYNVGLPH
jgi:hypothetical protein